MIFLNIEKQIRKLEREDESKEIQIEGQEKGWWKEN